MAADAVILPGVGAFGDAMETLARLDLVSVLRNVAASSKPLIGICLGMQLLLSESQEFGRHLGLGIIEGEVLGLPGPSKETEVYKVPHVGWNQIHEAIDNRPSIGSSGATALWEGSLIEGLENGEYMYFVHSYYARPVDSSITLSVTHYGQTEFCSSFRADNIFGCQFHPERSGQRGMQIYQNLAAQLSSTIEESMNA